MIEKYWPYVVPLPKKREDRLKFLLKIFGSNVVIDILEIILLKEKIAQKEIIEQLPYSNKTIINHLNELVSLGILEEHMKKVIKNNRRVWMKYYSLTKIGKWIALLVSSPNVIEKETFKEFLRELFRYCIGSVLELCMMYNIDMNFVFKIMNEELNKIKSHRLNKL